MDNRWRFLYCGMTELWGHVRKAEAGNGKPGASGVPDRDAERNKVAKSVSHASRKAAIVYTVPVP